MALFCHNLSDVNYTYAIYKWGHNVVISTIFPNFPSTSMSGESEGAIKSCDTHDTWDSLGNLGEVGDGHTVVHVELLETNDIIVFSDVTDEYLDKMSEVSLLSS